MDNFYNTGIVTVANGATGVVGVGTAFLTHTRAGDLFNKFGLGVRVATVVDDTHVTLSAGWPGTSLVGSTYEIILMPENSELAATTRQLLDQLSSGALPAIAALSPSANSMIQYQSGNWTATTALAGLTSVVATGAITAGLFTATPGATLPANGLYSSASGTIVLTASSAAVLTATGTGVTVPSHITMGASGNLAFNGRAQISSPADGVALFVNNAGTSFTRICYGGTSASFPAIARSAAGLIARLADDSADAIFTAASVRVTSATVPVGEAFYRPSTGVLGVAIAGSALHSFTVNGLVVKSTSNQPQLAVVTSSINLSMGSDGASGYFGMLTNHDLLLMSNGVQMGIITAAGEVRLGAAAFADQGAYLLQVNSQIWSSSGTLATSDLRVKDLLAATTMFDFEGRKPQAYIPPALLEAINEIPTIMYRRQDTGDSRLGFGYGAQHFLEVLGGPDDTFRCVQRMNTGLLALTGEDALVLKVAALEHEVKKLKRRLAS